MAPDPSDNASETDVNFEQYGIYHDDIVKVDREWKFAHRSFQSIYMESDGLMGQTVVARSALLR